jgi:peroxiredoxin
LPTKWFLLIAAVVVICSSTYALTAPEAPRKRGVLPPTPTTRVFTDPDPAPTAERVGFPVPEVVLRDLEGRNVPLSDFRGKVVALNLFATWCDPCKDEFPELIKLAGRLVGQDFVLLGVGSESVETLRRAAVEHGLNYPILQDAGRRLRNALGTETIPRTILVDRDGTVVAHHRGYRGDIRPLYRDLKKLGLKL